MVVSSMADASTTKSMLYGVGGDVDSMAAGATKYKPVSDNVFSMPPVHIAVKPHCLVRVA
jgi:hypothetical protein